MKVKNKTETIARYRTRPSGIIEQDSYCKKCDKDYLDHRSLIQHIQRSHK